jgi:hypothetical protein
MGRSTLLKKQKEFEKVAPFLKSLATPKASKPDRTRKISGQEMFEFYHLMLAPFREQFIRPVKTWISHSYNEVKRFHSFLRHLFCRYSVPEFFYRAFHEISGREVYLQTELEHWNTGDRARAQEWFVIVGRGESFHKASKEFFTAKEAHLFLKGTKDNWSDNAWWAKLTAHNWPSGLISVFLRRVPKFDFYANSSGNKFWNSIIIFFSRYLNELDADTLVELLDYLCNVPRGFSMNGRTLGSIIRLSNIWHTQLPKVAASADYIRQSWAGLPIADWECEANGKTWTVTQHKTGRGLAFEAKIQHHCVMGYADRCIAGQSGIFTLHSIDEHAERKHITIEVARGSVVQKKGKYNRIPTSEENNIISAWMGANGLRKW